jgi:hypothetical protein
MGQALPDLTKSMQQVVWYKRPYFNPYLAMLSPARELNSQSSFNTNHERLILS